MVNPETEKITPADDVDFSQRVRAIMQALQQLEKQKNNGGEVVDVDCLQMMLTAAAVIARAQQGETADGIDLSLGYRQEGD